MALKTFKIDLMVLKIAIFSTRKKISQRLEASLQTFIASGGWWFRPQTPVCDAFELL